MSSHYACSHFITIALYNAIATSSSYLTEVACERLKGSCSLKWVIKDYIIFNYNALFLQFNIQEVNVQFRLNVLWYLQW